MNAEKELLLALLIEKYTAKTTATIHLPNATMPITRRRQRSRRHEWTNKEKSHLITARNAGYNWDQIATGLGLTSKQVQSMHYTLTKRKAVSA